jgi:predicted RNase H-like nuclease (RuvC/YqgF family)
VPYRDELSANQEHVQRLTRELEETREELAELRAKYARAMAVLRVVAEGKKIEKLLEERKSVAPGSIPPDPKKA